MYYLVEKSSLIIKGGDGIISAGLIPGNVVIVVGVELVVEVVSGIV